MAEAGSFADRVKQQADIVRIIGDYVRLKKSGQNFTGLCPFHSEKTPSFGVHPVKQMYYCFGCGVGGDVFSFVMAIEKCEFPEALRTVAEKCGIPIPALRALTPGEKQANQQRGELLEMHREAAAFFAQQLESTAEGRAAHAYLEDRGLDREAIAQFGLGYAPSSGEALCRHLSQKHPDQLLHCRAVGLPAVDRLCAPGDERDHVRVVHVVQRLPVARVEEIITPRHEREEVLGPTRRFLVDGHQVASCWLVRS